MERCASIGGGGEKHLRSCRTSPHFSNLNGVTYTGRKLFDQCKTRYLNIVRCNYCLQATAAAIARLKIFTFTKVCFWGLKRAHGYAPITLPYHDAVIFFSALRYLHKVCCSSATYWNPSLYECVLALLWRGKGCIRSFNNSARLNPIRCQTANIGRSTAEIAIPDVRETSRSRFAK